MTLQDRTESVKYNVCGFDRGVGVAVPVTLVPESGVPEKLGVLVVGRTVYVTTAQGGITGIGDTEGAVFEEKKYNSDKGTSERFWIEIAPLSIVDHHATRDEYLVSSFSRVMLLSDC